jgi:DNA-binding NarL/FixJ family response regulator
VSDFIASIPPTEKEERERALPYGSCVLSAQITPQGESKLKIEKVYRDWHLVEPRVSRLLDYLQHEGWLKSAGAGETSATELSVGEHGTDSFNERLTRQQRAVLNLVMSGKDRLEIADELKIAVGTLDNHIQKICERLGLPISKSIGALARAVARKK